MAAQTGFRVTELFHATAVVADLVEVEEFYNKVWGVRSTTIPYSEQGRAYRTLTILGDTCIENLSPEQQHLSQFRMYHDIVGNHWFFPCFYVQDMQAALYLLHHRHRIRLTGAGAGNAVVGLPPPGNADRSLLYTHPADTGIMWEFWEGDEVWFRTNPLADPRKKPGWVYTPPATEDNLGVERLSHHTVVLKDAKLALNFLVNICAGKIFAQDRIDANGPSSTWVAVGDVPAVFELAQPAPNSPGGLDLARIGNTVHAVTFKVRDLSRAVAHLKRNGIKLETQEPHLVITDPATSCGLRFGFTESFQPNSPQFKYYSTRD